VRIEEGGDSPDAIDPEGEEIISENVWQGAMRGCVLP